MPSVHHDAAIEALNAIKVAGPKTGADFIAELTKVFPSWRSSAAPMRGYGDAEHHASVFVGRCLHDCLPVPYCSMKYNWEEQHGFATVVVYVEQAGRTAAEIATLLDDAIEECETVSG